MKQRKYVWLSTGIVLVLWGIFALIADNQLKMPTPWSTFKSLIVIMSEEGFLVMVWATFRRAMVGFLLAFSSALALGIVSGVSAPVYYLMRPIVLAQRSIPTMAVILVAIIWLGREGAPLLVCVLIVFPIIYSAVVTSIRDVDKKLLEMVEVYGLSRGQKLKHLYLPSIRSSLLGVSAAAISLNLKITIAAEVLGQPGKGIGTGFQLEKVSLNTAGIFAWAIVAIVLGALLEYLVSPAFLGLFFKRLKH